MRNFRDTDFQNHQNQCLTTLGLVPGHWLSRPLGLFQATGSRTPWPCSRPLALAPSWHCSSSRAVLALFQATGSRTLLALFQATGSRTLLALLQGTMLGIFLALFQVTVLTSLAGLFPAFFQATFFQASSAMANRD